MSRFDKVLDEERVTSRYMSSPNKEPVAFGYMSRSDEVPNEETVAFRYMSHPDRVLCLPR